MTTRLTTARASALLDTLCANDPDSDIVISIRNLLIDIDDETPDVDPEVRDIIRNCLAALDQHSIALMRLDHSLCPMHGIDYAICFDDRDPDCATIRATFPSHDT